MEVSHHEISALVKIVAVEVVAVKVVGVDVVVVAQVVPKEVAIEGGGVVVVVGNDRHGVGRLVDVVQHLVQEVFVSDILLGFWKKMKPKI